MRKILVIACAVAFVGCETSQHQVNDAQSVKPVLKFHYVNSSNPRDRLTLSLEDSGWQLLDYDLQIPVTVSATSPMEFFSEHLGIAFAFSHSLAREGELKYKGCDYRNISKTFYQSEAVKENNVVIYYFEANCEWTPVVSRYSYSFEYGLQSFSLGQNEVTDGVREFKASKVYYLHHQSEGFGAKNDG